MTACEAYHSIADTLASLNISLYVRYLLFLVNGHWLKLECGIARLRNFYRLFGSILQGLQWFSRPRLHCTTQSSRLSSHNNKNKDLIPIRSRVVSSCNWRIFTTVESIFPLCIQTLGGRRPHFANLWPSLWALISCSRGAVIPSSWVRFTEYLVSCHYTKLLLLIRSVDMCFSPSKSASFRPGVCESLPIPRVIEHNRESK